MEKQKIAILVAIFFVSEITCQNTSAEAISDQKPVKTGKLVNHPACRNDLLALANECRMTQNDFENDFAALTCAQSLPPEKFTAISETCEQVLWRFKLDMTKSPIFLEEIERNCERDQEKLRSCKNRYPYAEEAGHFMSCLIEEKLNGGLKPKCEEFLTQVKFLDQARIASYS